MATYQEQLERTKAQAKTKVIEGIFEDIRAGKYFGPEALSRAFDAGVASVSESKYVNDSAAWVKPRPLEKCEHCHRYVESRISNPTSTADRTDGREDWPAIQD